MATRPSHNDLALFNMELANLVRSGLPLSDGLKHLSREVRGEDFRRSIESVAGKLEQGQSLSEALASVPGVFSAEYLTLIRAGEEGSDLSEVLYHLTHYSRFQARTTNQIRTGMAYPVTVLCIAFILFLVIEIQIVPRFMELYEGAGARLPGLTQAIVDLSYLIRYHPVDLAAGLIIVVAALVTLAKTVWRPLWDRVKLRLPVAGPICRWRILIHYCEVVGYMLKQRIPMADALRLAAGTANNVYAMRTFDLLAEGVEMGDPLSRGMGHSALFPASLTWMVSEGERQERLDEVLRDASRLYMDHLESWSDRIARLVEPLLVMGLGMMIGTIVVALYLPLFKVGDVVR
jgi:type IV pilus assembly protein PilC